MAEQRNECTMQYMANHFDLRIDPSKLVPGAKSVITLLLNYFPLAQQNMMRQNFKVCLRNRLPRSDTQ